MNTSIDPSLDVSNNNIDCSFSLLQNSSIMNISSVSNSVADSTYKDFTGFSFVLQNIRSIRKNLNHLLPHILSLSSSPNFIFLTEIWAFDHELDSFKIPDYTLFACCNDSYRSGGVAVYMSNEINSKVSKLNCVSMDFT